MGDTPNNPDQNYLLEHERDSCLTSRHIIIITALTTLVCCFTSIIISYEKNFNQQQTLEVFFGAGISIPLLSLLIHLIARKINKKSNTQALIKNYEINSPLLQHGTTTPEKFIDPLLYNPPAGQYSINN